MKPDLRVWTKPQPKVAGYLVSLSLGLVLQALGAAPAANYEEAKVPPYTLPDPLVCEDGTQVKSAKAWKQKRRPELMRTFETEMFGKTPLGRPENLRFVLREEKKDARGGKATRLRVGILFAGREEGPQMELLVYLPNGARRAVPVFLGLNFDGNYSTTTETDIPLPKHWVANDKAAGITNHVAIESGRGAEAGRWQYDYALEHGYGVATACYCEVEPDYNGAVSVGVRTLAPPRGPSDWGAIGAWAWSLSRAMDYLSTHPRVNAKRVVVIGHSRLGKTSLWAGAQDERFAIVVSNDSGAGGAALSRRIFGEQIHNLNTSFPHWFCDNYKKYNLKEDQCSFDQHELIALIAPRPVLVNSATEDQWADPKGEFLSCVAASPVYRLHGKGGISQQEWPEPGKLLNSTVGYFLRPGKHDVTLEDWKAYIAFADRHLK